MTLPASAPVEVWRVALDIPAARLEACRRDLAADELHRADRFLREADGRRFAVARAALRRILGEALGLRPAAVRLAVSPSGKPTLAAAAGLAFNLSHSGEAAVLALSRAGEIGIDIERQRGVEDMLTIARAMFNPREVAMIERTPNRLRSAAFLRLWTAKEALLKATGVGLAGLADLAPDRRLPVERRDEPGSCGDLIGRRHRTDRRRGGWLVTPLAAPEGYVAALARPRDAGTVVVRTITDNEVPCQRPHQSCATATQ